MPRINTRNLRVISCASKALASVCRYSQALDTIQPDCIQHDFVSLVESKERLSAATEVQERLRKGRIDLSQPVYRPKSRPATIEIALSLLMILNGRNLHVIPDQLKRSTVVAGTGNAFEC